MVKNVMIASLPEREKMLERTVNSLRGQADHFYIALNNYEYIPAFLNDCNVILLDNSMGDAAKFWFAEEVKGYVLTCDDDLIYPKNYVGYMISGVKRYNCACSLHGRKYSRPVIGFQRSFTGYPCLNDVNSDVQVDIGGTGVMCYHTDIVKVKYSDFKLRNMADIWFGKLCKEQGVNIMCLAHRQGCLGYQAPAYTIWDEENEKGFVDQTKLLQSFL
jgi:hypothetical protein